ncbi:MAG: biotin--[acetyl-CoA-carboxylase] ligase [Anaerohalosphaera sp.]|nr:biotin--[acetyl-CoA-carboxylase] ligase [Anaerohalosphaera sp.]
MSDRLDVDAIEAGTANRYIGRKVLVYSDTASTNDVAWEYARKAANSGLAVFAEKQSEGRGRLGRSWQSSEGESLLCSMLLIGFEVEAEALTIAAAVATAEAMRTTCQVDVRIKWPNDIMINGKKVAGILVESKIVGERKDFVIGVGINCHQEQEFFETRKLKMAGTSLDIESGQKTDRNALAGNLLTTTDRWVMIARNDSGQVVNEWKRLCSQLGHRITVECDGVQHSGHCIGVDPARGLILQLDRGSVRMFTAAHTTIVKHL